MNTNKFVKTIFTACLCLITLSGQSEKTKVIRIFKGSQQVGEFVASNVDYVEVADPVDNKINGHEYVDLGLPSGLKWASCNMGAEARNQYGNVYFWGDTEPKSSTNNKCMTTGVELDDISGNPDYDAARAKWGSTWRLPTKEEAEELLSNCKIVYRNDRGAPGMLVTGPKGNQIFFPFDSYEVGAAYQWTSTPGDTNSKATYLLFYKTNNKTNTADRSKTYSIRPVSE